MPIGKSRRRSCRVVHPFPARDIAQKGWVTNRGGATSIYAGRTLLSAALGVLGLSLQIKIKIKGDGQECPPHLGYLSLVTVTSS